MGGWQLIFVVSSAILFGAAVLPVATSGQTSLPRRTVSARVTNDSAFAVPHNTVVALPFNTVRWDGRSLFDASLPTRLTSPKTGVYSICAHISWAQSAVGRREIAIKRNGVENVAADAVNGLTDPQALRRSVCTDYLLLAGDYVEVFVVQTSGGPLAISPGAESFDFVATRQR